MCKKFTQFGALMLLLALWGGVQASPSQRVSRAVEAQRQATCTGMVKDASGMPITGASVIVKGTTNGTTTIDGAFTLSNVPVGATLQVSFIGYKTTEATFNGATVNVTLEEDSTAVEEVVVTAYGVAKQAKAVGYATTRVSTSEIERANAVNPVNALQGKVAGVQINAGGASGLTSSSAITIRGAKSIDKNNSPIFVIDGMIIQENITGNLDGTDWGSQLKNLNPADYESVTVLKGAAATALYGSRGANGAIVIVSKGGKAGKKGIGVELNQTLEWTNVYKSPVDLQNLYGAGTTYNGTQGGFLADGTLQGTASSWGPLMDGTMVSQWLPHGQETPFVPHPDNWKQFYQTGLNSTTNVAISGGTEKSSFRLSYGYMDNKGVFIRNNFNRHNIAFRGLTELNKVFALEVGVQYAFSKAMNGGSQGGWDWGNNAGMLTTYNLPRNYDLADFKASYRDPETGRVVTGTSYFTAFSGYLWNREMNLNQRMEHSMLTDVKLIAHVTDWLDASVKVNYNYYGINTLAKSYPQQLESAPQNYGYSRGGSTSGSYNGLAMLQTKEFKLDNAGDFTLSAMLAAELYGNTDSHSWSKGLNGGMVVPGMFAFSNSVNAIIPNFNWTPRNQQTFGVFGILNLGWKDQLFLEVTARNDWLSTLTYPTYIASGQNNYSVFYPSVNASWVFSDTFADSMPDWFSFGKIRASLSRVGMGTSAYATARGFGVYNQNQLYLPDGSTVPSAVPNLGTSFNPDLKPEIQQSIEIGADIRFFDDRLNFDLAYYKTNTFNQIMSVASVSESGAGTKLINAGNIQNQGVEIEIEATPIRTKDWRWSIGGNFTLNRGKIKELDPNIKEWQLMGAYDAAPEIWAYEGGAFGVLTTSANSSYNSPAVVDPATGKFMIQYEGMYSNVPMYGPYTRYERNEEGDRDRIILGKVEPDFTLSVNTSLSWKNFDLYVQADGRFGGNYFSNMWKYASTGGTMKSSLEGRDREHGGIARIDYQGNTVYNGLMLDAVFREGNQAPVQNPDGTPGEMVDVGGMTYADAVAQKNIMPVMTGSWYAWNYGWGGYLVEQMPNALQDNTWFMLREITLGYRLPERLCKKFGANYLRVGFTARNICYIVNKLTDGLNPAAISSNNPLQPMDIGGVPFYRTFAVNLTVRF